MAVFLVFAKVQATESKGKHFGADTVGGTCNDSRYPCGEKKKKGKSLMKNAHNICPHVREFFIQMILKLCSAACN